MSVSNFQPADYGYSKDAKMTSLPNQLNGVGVEIDNGTVNEITDEMLEGLAAVIKPDAVSGHTLTALYLSSVKRPPEAWPNRHSTGNAVDISRVNGKELSDHYPGDDAVKAIIDALQNAFENFPKRCENYGPLFNWKEGQPDDPGDHSNHIHWSVDGPHQRP